MITFEKTTETAAGFREGSVNEYVAKLYEKGVNLHSLMLFRGGKLFCEEYAPGFDENFLHRLYSVSKTYVSAAVGIAEGEGKLSLDDRIIEYFRDKWDGVYREYLEKLTVRDCLMMATPFDDQPYCHTDYDWVKDFFTEDCTHRGGSLFHYDTGATLVLDELVHRVTGEHFNEYLYNKCLKYLGYDEIPECVEAPDGTKWGGSGMLCTARQFAAFALCWARSGKAPDGRQVIPAEYVRQAVKKQIGNHEENAHNCLRCHGYGYQTWMIKDGWAMFGMGDQLAFVYPGIDFMMVCTGDDQGNDFARTYIADYLSEVFFTQLKEPEKKPARLGMPVPEGENYSPVQEKVSERVYKLLKNNSGIEEISFIFNGKDCEMKFTRDGENKKFDIGMGYYKEGEFPEKNYSGIRINTPLGRGYRCFASAVWDMPDLLVIKMYAADMYFGEMTVNVRFSDDGIDLHFTKKAEWFFEEYKGFMTGK